MSSTASLLLRTALFVLLLPGAVTVYVPLWILGGRLPSRPPPLALIGSCLLICSGLALFAHTVYLFMMRGRGTPAPWDAPRQLVGAGAYAWSRNPMYIAVVTILFGEAWYAQSRALLRYAIIVAIGFHLRVFLVEELTLLRNFGASYERYLRTVPRWFGRRRT